MVMGVLLQIGGRKSVFMRHGAKACARAVFFRYLIFESAMQLKTGAPRKILKASKQPFALVEDLGRYVASALYKSGKIKYNGEKKKRAPEKTRRQRGALSELGSVQAWRRKLCLLSLFPRARAGRRYLRKVPRKGNLGGTAVSSPYSEGAFFLSGEDCA